jgi:hypothetical protein
VSASLQLAVVIGTLAAGTYLLRLGGILLAKRVPSESGVAQAGPGARLTRLLPYAAVALLAALSATAAFTQSGSFAGIARPAGVLAGLVAGLLRAPFAVAVLTAAAVAAGLRFLGVE